LLLPEVLTPRSLRRDEALEEGIKGQPGLYVGPQKTLKTNTAIDLVLSLASGLPFLGKFPVTRPVKSAFISGESGQATIQETARRVALSKRQPLRNYDNVHFVFNLPSLTSEDDLYQLRVFLENNAIEFLFLDPLYLMLDGIGDGAGNLFTMGPLLRKLAELMQQLHVTVFLCHHTKNRERNRQYEPTELEDIAWSGFREFARQWILLGRRSAYDPESNGHHELWLNCGGSAGHSELWGLDITEGRRTDDTGRRWDVAVNRASTVRSRAIDQQWEQKEAQKEQRSLRTHERRLNLILAEVKQHPQGESKTAIRKAVRMGGSTFNPVWEELLETGQIAETEIVKNGRTETGYIVGRTRPDNGRTKEDCPGDGRWDRTPPPEGGCPVLSDRAGGSDDLGGTKRKLSDRTSPDGTDSRELGLDIESYQTDPSAAHLEELF